MRSITQCAQIDWNREHRRYLRDMLVPDEIESETGLWMASPGEALATILPHARLVPLHRYLAAAERPDTDHNLQIGIIKRITTPRGARRNARGHRPHYRQSSTKNGEEAALGEAEETLPAHCYPSKRRGPPGARTARESGPSWRRRAHRRSRPTASSARRRYLWRCGI
jgi:hypothetical protein